jgi:hypothetical protein
MVAERACVLIGGTFSPTFGRTMGRLFGRLASGRTKWSQLSSQAYGTILGPAMVVSGCHEGQLLGLTFPDGSREERTGGLHCGLQQEVMPSTGRFRLRDGGAKNSPVTQFQCLGYMQTCTYTISTTIILHFNDYLKSDETIHIRSG